MSSCSSNLASPQPVFNSAPIIVSNGATMFVTHRASSTIPTAHRPLHLNNVLVSPSLVKNLISVRSLTRDNNVLLHTVLLVFLLRTFQLKRCSSDVTAMVHCTLWLLLHQRPSSPPRPPWTCGISDSVTQGAVFYTKPFPTSNLLLASLFVCETCQLGKHIRLPFQSSTSVSYVPIQIVHVDVWTSPLSSFSGFKYYLVLIDDLTHYVCVKL
jgi:hypothetical protein